MLGLLARAFNQSESALLAEPSIAYRSKRPPDIVLIDPEVGVHVVAVKGVTLDQVKSVPSGGISRPMIKSEKDTSLCRPGHLTFSTVASAKGYDAFVTLLVSANESGRM